MFKQIRSLFGEELEEFSGEVEADDTYVGWRQRGKPGPPGRDSNKSPVVGVVERDGKDATLITKDAKNKWKAYDGLSSKGYEHKRIPHAEKVYVIGNVHTNTMEGFWSLLKRGISGVYHSVSDKHLQSYVNEYAFRYNHRDDTEAMYKTTSQRITQVRHGRHGKYAPIGPAAPTASEASDAK